MYIVMSIRTSVLRYAALPAGCLLADEGHSTREVISLSWHIRTYSNVYGYVYSVELSLTFGFFSIGRYLYLVTNFFAETSKVINRVGS